MGDLKLPPHWGGSFLSYHICVWAGLRPARRFSVAAPICESPLALPLRELSAKLTERVGMVVVDPLRLSLRSDTSPKGGGKAARRLTARFSAGKHLDIGTKSGYYPG